MATENIKAQLFKALRLFLLLCFLLFVTRRIN